MRSCNITGANGDRTIIIDVDIRVGAGDAIPAITSGKNITLTTVLDKGYRIYRTATNTSMDTGMFTINSGGNLMICNNGSGILTLDGNRSALTTNNNQPLVYVNGGTFTMEGGSISNNYCENGGGVYVDSGRHVHDVRRKHIRQHRKQWLRRTEYHARNYDYRHDCGERHVPRQKGGGCAVILQTESIAAM